MAQQTQPQPKASHHALKVVVASAAVVILIVLLDSFLASDVAGYTDFADRVYVSETVTAILVLIGSYLIYKLADSLLHRSISRITDPGTLGAFKLILKIIFYMAVIALVLSIYGFNLSGALAGGAIGGIIIGLAVQTVATNILSGFFVSSSKALKPGEAVILTTSSLGTIICEVNKVNILWAEVTNQNGNTMRIPNSVLMGSSLFTNLRTDDYLTYVATVSTSADVPAKKIMASVRSKLKDQYDGKMPAPSIILASKAVSGVNTYSVFLKLDKLSSLNRLLNSMNLAFDEAYSELKK